MSWSGTLVVYSPTPFLSGQYYKVVLVQLIKFVQDRGVAIIEVGEVQDILTFEQFSGVVQYILSQLHFSLKDDDQVVAVLQYRWD